MPSSNKQEKRLYRLDVRVPSASAPTPRGCNGERTRHHRAIAASTLLARRAGRDSAERRRPCAETAANRGGSRLHDLNVVLLTDGGRVVCCEAGELGVRASAARIAPGVVVVPCRLMVDSRTMPPDPEPIPFGVGCFYFVPTEPAPETGQSARYRDLIQAALEAIPNTNNIVIEGGEDPDPLLLPLQGSWPSLDAPVFNAYPSYLNIEFDLYIPARIQEQILNSLGEGFVGSEHFHVRLIHSDMPLVMVTATEPVGWKAGSTYIILVREYLQRELDESMVGLSCLGPSPFHSDFFLELGQQQGRPLIVRREQPTLGYSQHWCSYESSGHDDENENDIRQALRVRAKITS